MNDCSLVIKMRNGSFLDIKPSDVRYSFSHQYKRDSFFYSEGEDFLLFIGICHNKPEICREDLCSWPKAAMRIFKKNYMAFLESADGYFCGLFYDSKKQDVLLFSDHLSTIPMYYFRNENFFVVDTDLFRLVQSLRGLGVKIHMSDFGAYSMLAYSFMLENHTLLADIYKVYPATIYSFRKNKSEKYFEYYVNEKKTAYSMDYIAEGIDYFFRKAIKNAFSSDTTSSHLVTLSGGLDSRMCLFYALKSGYHNITTLNYSQTFYREEIIAKKIAADCNCEHVFFSLDNGNYLSHIDEGIYAIQGMTTYRPILSPRMVWKRMEMKRFGFVHTGLLGDTIIGGYCIDKCNPDDRFHSPADLAIQLNPKNRTVISSTGKDNLSTLFNQILEWIPETELLKIHSEKFVLDNRYINGLMQSALGTRGITVQTSPYTSKQLMKFIYSFPSTLRLNHELYFKWMKSYMPEATRYIWENTGLKPMYYNFSVKPHDKISELYKQIDTLLHPLRPERSRNPYSFWMKHNENIQKQLYGYCENKMFLLEDNKELFKVAYRILQSGNIYLLIRLATLLGFYYICNTTL